MTSRELVAAALAVWAVGLLAELAGWHLPFALYVEYPGLYGMLLPSLALAAFLILAGRRMARALGEDTEDTGWRTSASQIQLAGLHVLGVYLLATGLQGVADAGIRNLIPEPFGSSGFLRESSEGLAGSAVGVLLTLFAPRLHAWIQRDQQRQLKRAAEGT